MFHVVYLAYSPSLNLYYIGKKSFKKWVQFNKYQTSSSNLEFVKSNKTKRILGYYNCSKEAIEAEIYFQHLFKVKSNDLFANRSYQTSKGFDTLGLKFNLTEEQKQKVRDKRYPSCKLYRYCPINIQNKSPKKTKIDIDLVRRLLNEGLKQKEIAERLNVNQSTISRIKGKKRNAYSRSTSCSTSRGN